MIHAGEASGTLASVLDRLAILGEREEETRRMIKQATRYPILVISALIAAFFVLVSFVLPRFIKIFAQFKAALPLPTRILLGISHIVNNYWYILIPAVVAIALAFRAYIRTPVGKKQWDQLTLKLPVFGPLILKIHMSRFSRITGNLLMSGLPIVKIFELVSGSIGNVIIANTLGNIKEDIVSGKTISEPMRTSNMFPPVVVQMVSVGEDTGKIDELLLQVADYYEKEVDYTVKNLGSYIEPFLLLVLGCGVLFMALAVFLPMWDMVSIFKR
jgi:MSHA biogenesis protein MshG